MDFTGGSMQNGVRNNVELFLKHLDGVLDDKQKEDAVAVLFPTADDATVDTFQIILYPSIQRSKGS